MLVVLISEKPSIAEAIARNFGSSYQHRKEAMPVYEFTQKLDGKECVFLSTSVAGHIYEVDFCPELNNWAVPPTRLFEKGNIRYSPASGGSKVIGHLKHCCKKADKLILCLDNDREGENISFEVLRTVKDILPKGCQVHRARFSAVTKSELIRAFSNLDSPNKNMSDAVEARQEIDLKIGVAFTRYQSTELRGMFSDLRTEVVSYGPCQTPTLGFCVERHDEITRFRPKPYYELLGSIYIGGETHKVRWLNSRADSSSALEKRMSAINEAGKKCRITTVNTSTQKKVRPLPMNTVEMLKQASTRLGLSPFEALTQAEHLYISGFISYPRTESTVYPESFDLKSVVKSISKGSNQKLVEHSKLLLTQGLITGRKGTDCGDHPPITPTDLIPGPQGNTPLYSLIAKHFLATISPDAVYSKMSIEMVHDEIPEERFSLGLIRLDTPGWKALYETIDVADKNSDEEDLTADADSYLTKETLDRTVFVGAKLTLTNISIVNGMTKPPSHLSEADLLGLMERHGIGTDASMATHINNIVTRTYVEIKKTGRKRLLVPSSLGISLVHGYHIIDSDLVSPQLRANIERDVTQVAEGKVGKQVLIDRVLEKFLGKFLFFQTNFSKLIALLEAKFSSIRTTGRPFVRCGDCWRYMRLIEQSPPRIYCPQCDKLYTLPSKGKLVAAENAICPYDSWPLVGHTLGQQEKHTLICPRCYVYGAPKGLVPRYKEAAKLLGQPTDFEDVQALTCETCLNGDCKYSLVSRTVGRCPMCSADKIDVIDPSEDSSESTPEDPPRIVITIDLGKGKEPEKRAATCASQITSGFLYLDTATQKNFPQVCCTGCKFIAAIVNSDVKMLSEKCSECGLRKIRIDNVRVPELRGTSVTGCVLCDKEALARHVTYPQKQAWNGRRPHTNTRGRRGPPSEKRKGARRGGRR
ncbi:DNA topoisomerase III [Giardia muris]|uniref:DNA topoisomerase n=1 Tax=Giardia muris TaxID=5742 RepID=A0A4Z1TDQ7_GIAMU|nr:DNA topoisomerase III [Giardia muris]|eukprot:TNJ30689.1 DNA topoisomerase III [Giardia muris]